MLQDHFLAVRKAIADERFDDLATLPLQRPTPSEELARTLFQHARERMAPYKLPRLIEFVTELPKTMSGKIRRVELRGMEADRKAKGIKGPHEYSPGGR